MKNDSASAQEPEEWRAKIADFVLLILHGDAVHQAWLRDAGEAFILGKPIPTPRDNRKFTCACCGRGANELDSPHYLQRVNRLGDVPAVWMCTEHLAVNAALSSLREKIKALEEKEAVADHVNAVLQKALEDILDECEHAPLPLTERITNIERIADDALSVVEPNANQPTPPLNKDAEILSLRAELQEAEKLTQDSLSALEALSPFYRRSPIWETARIHETIEALRNFLELKEPNSDHVNAVLQKALKLIDEMMEYVAHKPDCSENDERGCECGYPLLTEQIEDFIATEPLVQELLSKKPNEEQIAPPVNKERNDDLPSGQRQFRDTLNELESLRSRLAIQTEALKEWKIACAFIGREKFFGVPANIDFSKLIELTETALSSSEAVDKG